MYISKTNKTYHLEGLGVVVFRVGKKVNEEAVKRFPKYLQEAYFEQVEDKIEDAEIIETEPEKTPKKSSKKRK